MFKHSTRATAVVFSFSFWRHFRTIPLSRGRRGSPSSLASWRSWWLFGGWKLVWWSVVCQPGWGEQDVARKRCLRLRSALSPCPLQSPAHICGAWPPSLPCSRQTGHTCPAAVRNLVGLCLPAGCGLVSCSMPMRGMQAQSREYNHEAEPSSSSALLPVLLIDRCCCRQVAMPAGVAPAYLAEDAGLPSDLAGIRRGLCRVLCLKR